MGKRSEYVLAMIFGSMVGVLWGISKFFKKSPALLNLEVLDGVSAGAQIRLIFRKDASRVAFIALSFADRAIVALDERSRERLNKILEKPRIRKWSGLGSPSFTMHTLPRFNKVELRKRTLLVAGLKRIEVTVEPPGRFGGNLRLVVSH